LGIKRDLFERGRVVSATLPRRFIFGGIMFYWRVRAGIKNPDIDKEVIPECIISLVSAEDANEAIIKVINEFPQYNLFITSVQSANDE
jgi:hypothetical protein